jgi:hypothetical protein
MTNKKIPGVAGAEKKHGKDMLLPIKKGTLPGPF